MVKAWWAVTAAATAMAGGAMAQAPARNPAQAAWAGEYRYEHDGGRTAGGSPILRIYRLRVGATPTDCTLDIEGFQADEHILCEVAADASNLWIRFRSYADGQVRNRYGVALYQPGRDLFRLRYARRGAPVTEWDTLKPEERPGLPAVRFRKG